jgi:hypothetical protein
MTRRTAIVIGVVALVVAVIALWPWRSSRARQLAEQAATPAQKALWQAVADRGTPPGLERLPVARGPIERRNDRRPPAPRQTIPPGRGSLAPGVVNGIRMISSGLPPTSSRFTGNAVVQDVAGDRVDLDIGGGRQIAFVARIGGQPLALATGNTVQVVFESRPGFLNRREIAAVQTSSGTLVASAFESGPTRITLNVGPPLNLTAQQHPNAAPAGGSLAVTVTIGKSNGELKPGATDVIEGVNVRLVGSVAMPSRGAADASPYAIDLVAWRQSGK